MVFSSLIFFFCFLPAVLMLYFISPKRLKNLTLFVCSLVFYAWGEPVYVLLMLFSTAVDYVHGRLVGKYLEQGSRKKARRAVVSSAVINIALLCVFKYSDFFVSAVNGVLGTDIPLPGLPLPIGISFYTFQTMSYTIDVYRGQARVQKNIISFGAYVSLFPQLIAGPIVRYSTIAESLDNRTVTPDAFGEGAKRFCIGLGKKVLIANNVGMIWDSVSGGDIQTLPVFTAWLGIIAFALQIYFDFSGYSDMAIGLGKMFGFDFLENFNYPYMSESVTEFWRRWHISLGTWFREYVYIPLGGSRCSKAKNFRNIAIVWLLTGLWHGASWNFLLWGAWFGVLLIAEKCFLLKLLDRAPSAVAHIYTLLAVLFSWVIFSFDKVSEIAAFFRAMLGLNGCGFADTDGLYLFLTNSVLLAVAVVACTNLPKRLAEKLSERAGTHQVLLQSGRAAVCAALLLLSTSYLVDSVYNPFLYFRF